MQSLRTSWLLPSLLLSLPVLGWLVLALAYGFTLAGDNAYIAIRTHDVFSANPPLLGMPSTAGNDVAGLSAFHPGPVQFFLMAPIYAISGWQPWGLALGAVTLNLSIVVTGLWAAWRTESPWAKRSTVMTMIIMVIVLQAFLYTPWNPWPMALGLVTLVVIAWAIALGRSGLWPAAVVVMSIVAQGHVLGSPVAATIVVSLFWLLWHTQRGARPSSREALVSAGLLMVFWAPPLVEMAMNWPGNPGQWWTYARGDRGSSETLGVESHGVWLGGIAMILIAAVMAGRRGWRTLKDVPRGADLDDRGVMATGLVLLSVTSIGIVVTSLLGGADRQLYLLYLLGPFVLTVVALASRSGVWRAPVIASMGVIAVAPLVFGMSSSAWKHEWFGSLDQSRLAISESRQLLASEGNVPVVVLDEGSDAWAQVAPAIRAALIADGRQVHFDYRWRPDDYDQQRRVDRVTGPHLVLQVIQASEDGIWPSLAEGEELGTADIPSGDPVRTIRLVLTQPD